DGRAAWAREGPGARRVRGDRGHHGRHRLRPGRGHEGGGGGPDLPRGQAAGRAPGGGHGGRPRRGAPAAPLRLMLVRLAAGLLLLALLWWAFRLSMALRWSKVERERRRAEEQEGGRV